MDDSPAQDFTEAARWARIAAEQGDADAQFTLGWHYAKGFGVSRDNIEACMWYGLAAAHGNEAALRNKKRLEQHMTPEDISTAARLTRTWVSKNT